MFNNPKTRIGVYSIRMGDNTLVDLSADGPRVGKRSDPSYRQISTYVKSDIYRLVKRELVMEERDFSDLMNELLAEWLSKRQV